MKVARFLLSGREYGGDEAARLFEIAHPYGVEEIVTVSRAEPERFTGWQHYVYADVSCVSAHWTVLFDSREEMEAWAATVPMPERTEENGIACYRALIGYMPEVDE